MLHRNGYKIIRKRCYSPCPSRAPLPNYQFKQDTGATSKTHVRTLNDKFSHYPSVKHLITTMLNYNSSLNIHTEKLTFQYGPSSCDNNHKRGMFHDGTYV